MTNAAARPAGAMMIRQNPRTNTDQALDHRQFRDDEFWREIPAWREISRQQFGDHHWQSKNSIRKVSQLATILKNRISQDLIDDIERGMGIAPMNVRITPYVFSLINWDQPLDDPLRKQFLPLASQMLPDHPYYLADSLSEDVDAPVPYLTHRYPDKVLFLPLTTCPVYCSYCTRSRIIGGSTDSIEKDTYGPNPKNWEAAFDYLRRKEQVEDVVISGGDVFNLTARYIELIGSTLLDIPHIRRLRFATKGIAILPMKILTDVEWVDALLRVHQKGLSLDKQVVVHTHFSSPREVTEWSRLAMQRLFRAGVIVRNQAVLQHGVNNDIRQMVLLTRQLAYINIQPYYVYLHDMVPGCEHLRTTLGEAIEIAKHVRGSTAGFNTPTFVCDAPGGGGKRHVASYEYYDKVNGISVWRAPNVKPDELFLYFDPIHRLGREAQARWADLNQRNQMVQNALDKVDPTLGEFRLDKLRERLATHQLK